MSFLQVKDGLSVRKSAIEAIERTDDMKCKIHTASNCYESIYPYTTMVIMLGEDKDTKTNQLLESIINNQQRVVA